MFRLYILISHHQVVIKLKNLYTDLQMYRCLPEFYGVLIAIRSLEMEPV
jgi:hypothetical protein